MTHTHHLGHSIETLADEYARSRKARISPISMKAAIRAVRTILPSAHLDDRELSSVIAERVVEHGHSVDFDASEPTKRAR